MVSFKIHKDRCDTNFKFTVHFNNNSHEYLRVIRVIETTYMGWGKAKRGLWIAEDQKVKECWFVFDPSVGRWLDSARWPAPPRAGFIGLSERSRGKEGTICCFELIDKGRNTVRQSTHSMLLRSVIRVSLSDFGVPNPPPRYSSEPEWRKGWANWKPFYFQGRLTSA